MIKIKLTVVGHCTCQSGGFFGSCGRFLVRMSCRLYTESQMMFGYAGVNINAVILQLQAVIMGLFADLS